MNYNQWIDRAKERFKKEKERILDQITASTKEQWAVRLDAPPVAQLVAAEGMLFVPTRPMKTGVGHSTLYALSQSDNGRLRWKQQFPGLTIRGVVIASGTPAQSESQLIISQASLDPVLGVGRLASYDLAGNRLWHWENKKFKSLSEPALSPDQKIACVTADASFVLFFDTATGELLTVAKLRYAAALSAPTLTNTHAYIPCRGPYLLAMGFDGRRQWKYDGSPQEMWLNQTPIVYQDKLYAVSNNGRVLAFDLETGRLLWQKKVQTTTELVSPLGISEAGLYLATTEQLCALEFQRGDYLWRYPLENQQMTRPVVYQGIVYATGKGHQVVAAHAESGESLWDYKQSSAGRLMVSPLPVSGLGQKVQLFVADRDGVVRCLVRQLVEQELTALQQKRRDEAVTLEMNGELDKAAAIWSELNMHERAAELYETIQLWDKAAIHWSRASRRLKQANAIKHYALQLETSQVADDKRATVWSMAEKLFREEGRLAEAQVCHRYVAKYKHLPILTLDVKHEQLVLDEWSRIELVLKNVGFGTARSVRIRAKGTQFNGQVAETQQLQSVRPGETCTERVDLQPKEIGRSVPLRILLDYGDSGRAMYQQEETLYVPVVRHESHGKLELVQPIQTIRDPRLQKLYKLIMESLSRNDLQTICFLMDIDEENLAYRKDAMAQELLIKLHREKRLTELIKICKRDYPHMGL